jgi:hypothetical protein
MADDVRYTVGDAIRMAGETAERLRESRKQLGIIIDEQQLNGETPQELENDPWYHLARHISRKARDLAIHPDIDQLYALCLEQCGKPEFDPAASSVELLLSHVADKVERLISKVVLAKGVHSADLRKMSCPDFCRLDFAADDAAQHREEKR